VNAPGKKPAAFKTKCSRFAWLLWVFWALTPLGNLAADGAAEESNVPPRKDYRDVVSTLKPFIERQIAEKQLPALSIALVDDQEIVWAEGFGLADPKTKRPATAETIYRIGSVSKLFTDIAVMQLVEQGKLDLDAPVANYLPDFRPKNPFGIPITLRQLMSHRSGLLREPSVGNYFDPTEPSLSATVRSMRDSELIYAPGTHTKYSNAGIAVVGYLLETKSQQPFASYVKHAVLESLGLRQSSFEPEPNILRNLAKGEMWTYDGRAFEAPTFQIGMAPAGSMYSTVKDLGSFVGVLLARGKTADGQILGEKALDEMWSPQFPNPGGRTFGLGFILGELDKHRLIGHGGAIYGFATTLDFLPDDKLGVVVVATKDCANAVTNRIAEETLRAALSRRASQPMNAIPGTNPVADETARKFAGRYGNGDEAVDLTYLNGKLTMLPVDGGHQVGLRQRGDDLIVDSILDYGTRVTAVADGIVVGPKALARVRVQKPSAVPEAWKGLIGEYGWDHDILYVFEKEGRLCVLIEWIEYDVLRQISEDVFNFPNHGLYDGEKAIFTRDAGGQARQVQVSGVVFKRRSVGGMSGEIFRVPAVKNFSDLRRKALSDQPPVEAGDFRKADLVELATLDPTIKLDIRYASQANFLGTAVYSEPRAFLQRPAAEALLRVHHRLKELGYGLLIHDAYRPWYVTKIFWDATPDDKKIFVADPLQGSRHNRGCAVDLSLYDLGTGKPIEMVGVYDEMSERSYPGYPGGTSLQRWYREVLRHAMESEDFTVYEFEWWHFDFKNWQLYPILNLTFERLAGTRTKSVHRVVLHKIHTEPVVAPGRMGQCCR
jgi:CubicO group peptidase (beta-lactamase class C family)/D-alanyl-D-alanine dipeptidase